MRKLTYFLLCGVSAFFPAASFAGSLGIATTLESPRVDGTVLSGTSDVAEGSIICTTTAPSQVALRNGATMLLATRSEGAFYSDHVQLEKGAIRADHFDLVPVRAKGLTITADTGRPSAVVSLSGKTVEVASIGGGVLVSDGGAFLARVLPGKRMAFKAQDSSQTGASRGDHGGLTDADRKALWWSIAAIGGAAVVIGSIAAAEGKSPF